jgi:predicted aldo/keto reductase-like oxidoreductase
MNVEMRVIDMKKYVLGNSGIEVTRFGMGVLTVGRTQLDLGLSDGARIVRYALERGINFLDTAEYYETYPFITEALKGFKGRDDVVIASKSLTGDYDAMYAAVEDYRKAFDRDYADIFLLHELREAPDFENRRGAWECLCELKAKGVVKAIGISTHHVDCAELNAKLPESDILFPLINMSSLGIRRGAEPSTKEDMAAAIKLNSERGKGVFAMKAFAGGVLTSRYMEALDYVGGLPGVDSIMLGIGSEGDIDNIIDYEAGRLPEDFQPEVAHKKIRIDQGDCEGCGACVARGPNKAICMKASGTADVDHEVCLTCGYCAPVCPVRAIIMW